VIRHSAATPTERNREMRRTRRERKRRTDIGPTLGHPEEELWESLRKEEMIAKDLDTVIETLSKLTFEGTFEDMDGLNATIKDARDVTADTFRDEDHDMDPDHSERDAYRGDLHDHAEKDESDTRSVSEAVSRVDTREAQAKLNDTRDRVVEDLKFLCDSAKAAQRAEEATSKAPRSIEGFVRQCTSSAIL